MPTLTEDEFPQYEDDGSEILGFQNLWRDIEPQEILGADCFLWEAHLNPDANFVLLKLTADEYKKMFSALYVGAEIAYPDSFMQILINFQKGIYCPPFHTEECLNYPTYAAFMQYKPQNPYTDPNFVPDGYILPPMVVINEANQDDYPDNELFDIIVQLNSFPLDTGWLDDINEALPSVEIRVNGHGTMDIKLLPQPNGGMAIITLDNPPNLIDILAGIITGADNIIDVNKDVLSVPPETSDIILYPLEIEDDAEHTIYIVFFPVIDDSLIPIRFGGGFRGIELCGFVGTVNNMGITNICYFNGEEPENRLQFLLNGVWTPVCNWGDIENELVGVEDNISSLFAADANLLSELNDQDDRISVLEAAGSWDEARIAAIEADNLLQWDTLNEHADWLDNIQGDVWNLYERVDRSDEEILGVGNFDWGNTRIDQLEILANGAAQEWSHTFDFLTDEAGWSSSVNTYSSGNGWIVDNGVTFDIHHGSTIILDNAISYIKLELKQKSGSGTRKKVWFNASGDNEQYIQMPSSADGIIEQWMQINYRDTSSNTVHFLIDSNVASAEWYIRSMTIYGRGTDVF